MYKTKKQLIAIIPCGYKTLNKRIFISKIKTEIRKTKTKNITYIDTKYIEMLREANVSAYMYRLTAEWIDKTKDKELRDEMIREMFEMTNEELIEFINKKKLIK